MEYTIYKGLKSNGEWKIGCDQSYPNRALEQNLTDYFILESYEDIMIASNREIELQKEHGVEIDRCLYYQTKINAAAASRSAVRNGNHNFQRSSGLRKPNKPMNKDHQFKFSQAGGLARKGIPNPAAAEFCKEKLHNNWTCENCGKSGKGAGNFSRYHKNNKCKI